MQSVVQGAADVLRFPVWWYSQGLARALTTGRDFVTAYANSLALSIWVKNIFVPMFGRHDWQSRIISVFMRVMNIFFRGIALVVLILLALVALVFYVALPMVSALFALYHLSALII